jgi:hypothetical protein
MIYNGMEISVIHHQQCFLIHLWFDSSDCITCSAKFGKNLINMTFPGQCVYNINSQKLCMG